MTTFDGFLEVDCAIKACQAVQVAPKEVGHEDLKRMISSIKKLYFSSAPEPYPDTCHTLSGDSEASKQNNQTERARSQIWPV
jgi:hypothetical protein